MSLHDQIVANRWRTFVVLAGFALLIALLGGSLSLYYDPGILGIVGIIGIVYGTISYFASGSIVASATGARPVSAAEVPRLHRAVEHASLAAALDKTPDVYIVEDVAPNAFAAGRNLDTAYVAATTGLLDLLDDRELAGVMAHEIAHVRNRDVRLMSIAAVLAGVIALVSDMLLRMTIWGGGGRRDSGLGPVAIIIGVAALILAPISAVMLQMSLSRRREYLADASAVELTGDADALASALYKLGADHNPLRRANRATAHMYIESPLRDQPKLRSSIGGMFDTHPPLQKRIDRLVEMGGIDPRMYALGADDPEAHLNES